MIQLMLIPFITLLLIPLIALLFDCLFGVLRLTNFFSLICTRYHYRRASKFYLYSALRAFEKWGFFSVLHLLWWVSTVFNGHLRGAVTERLTMELSLRLWFVATGTRTYVSCMRFRSVPKMVIQFATVQLHILWSGIRLLVMSSLKRRQCFRNNM